MLSFRLFLWLRKCYLLHLRQWLFLPSVLLYRQRCSRCLYDCWCESNEQCCNSICISSFSSCSCSHASGVDWARNARTTTNVTVASSTVIANASVVCLLVPVRTSTNVDGARNAVIANASVVRLLVPAHTTTNVDGARNAEMGNAWIVRLVIIRPTTNVTLGRIVVGEFVPYTMVGATQLFQSLLSTRLSSSPSSFQSYSAAAVLVACTIFIVHPVLWSSPANSHNNKPY